MEGRLYPILYGLEECSGVCPICLMDMGGQMPKYDCENGHTMCHRCKPYYWACSVCTAPLNYVPPFETDSMDSPPPIHFMPHPMHRRMDMPMPSAPPETDMFLANERGQFGWGPPPPGPEQYLAPCAYSHYGCWIRLPEYIRELHETRCQFRPYLEVEHLPTDLPLGDDCEPCFYAEFGCNVMMQPWRKPIHEPLCIFKDRFEAEAEPEEPADDEDPDEMVECKLKIYGCLVKMPRRRKIIHEEKCNYNKYYKEEDFEPEVPEEPEEAPEEEIDPDSQVDCRWAEHGCRIRPKLHRKEVHEDKCNYKMEPCSFSENGCEEMFVRSRRFAHERNCEFKN